MFNAKATQKHEPKLSKSDAREAVLQLAQQKADSAIFAMLGIAQYERRGSRIMASGAAALQGTPGATPVGAIGLDNWYTAEELLQLYVLYATQGEMEQLLKQ